ncbi:amino acid permease [Mycobacterium sp. CBMA293]|uniref:amino acid permease n=1 Tax=unclassified Mycolicibacterium TaxID=2636767 RepID=UPI0012DC9595|nr:MULTISPECIES: amino acid permease [unclassified Mycolicibacterium]MUL45007.1 amino acid permease [Mycolicibacterium sp. CBMA 360]MUL57883.1 amino acid permease [Mycolicibacterium sp. CBMA 335]MUL72668.1 amino acid permease [Mycolicibacterium sp. CBMA 311]MUL95601.1 amino acid permease [Mycolicibacterium sp. CBMA 230]MUM07313.1 amino acid permease [Mycolicibacterium sp. CBMA 213]
MTDSSTPPDGAVVNAGGYTDTLERSTGRFASFAVAFAFVSIATGIFTTYGSVLKSSGPLGIWTWPLVVVGQLAVALLLGSLAARIPVTGYAYQWVSRLANPVLGWITGWISFSFLAIVAVAVDYTVAATVVPALFDFTGTALTSFEITAGILLLQGLLVGVSTKWTERVNNFAVSAELIGMVALVVLLFIVGVVTHKLSTGNLFSRGGIPADGYWSLGTATSAGPWMLGFLLGAFTIVGFESAANLAEETKRPEVVVPKAMWQAVLASGILGFLFLLVVTAAVNDPATLAQSGTPIADVIRDILGSVVGTSLLILVAIAIFACGLVIVMSGVRLVWAMSRDQRFPGWQLLHKVSPRFKTPLNATVAMTTISAVILGLFSTSTDALFVLFSAATLLPAIIYAITVALYIATRRRLPASAGFNLGRWETPIIVVAVIWLVFVLALFRDSSFAQPWLYVAAMVAIGAVYLIYLLITRGRHGLKMPELRSIDAELDQVGVADDPQDVTR